MGRYLIFLLCPLLHLLMMRGHSHGNKGHHGSADVHTDASEFSNNELNKELVMNGSDDYLNVMLKIHCDFSYRWLPQV